MTSVRSLRHMRMGHMHMFGNDPSAVAGQRFDRVVLRRAWGYATPYRAMIGVFIIVVIAMALLQLVPPVLFGRILDDGIAEGNRRLVTILSILVVSSAVLDALLGLLERYLSSRVGEGLIHDLRVSLYDHVQRMPIAFFTHTQTGTLVSRLNNDVIGAQRAVTGTLGQVVSNVVTVVSTVATMAIIDWRLTALALVLLPVFIVPAKRVGKVRQRLTRMQMDENAAMNNIMTERFGVSGAQLVKLFGRPDEETAAFAERAAHVRGPRGPQRDLCADVPARAGSGRRGRNRSRLLDRWVDGYFWIDSDRHPRHLRPAGRPDIRPPDIADQRQGRCHDCPRLLRPRVRCPGRADGHRRPPRRHRSHQLIWFRRVRSRRVHLSISR